MANFFFGKITDKIDPKQLPQGYYEASSKSWFGNIKEGDYVFIVAGSSKGAGKVHFWRARKWSENQGKFRMDFDKIVDGCISKPVLLSSLIFFKLNMELIIKSVRPTATDKKGFFEMIPIDRIDNLEELLCNSDTYKETSSLFRKIIIYNNLATLENDTQMHDNDIQLYYDADGIIKIKSKSFIDDKLIKDFHGEMSKIKGKNKERILENFKLDGETQKEVKISLRDFYDTFISKNNNNSPKNINSTSPNTSNTYSNQNINVIPPIDSTENVPLNQILYGPPGTGKTYRTIEYALKILLDNTDPTKLHRTEQKKIFDKLKKDGRIVFTTFHQSMSYEDFVQGIKPKTDKNGNIIYKVENGIFRQICEKAKTAQSHKITVEGTEYSITNNCVLIIDEINRGNVSEIFGELITLIESDKRIGEDNEITVQLPTSDNSDDVFGVPNNVYIIGTMNTADRSVEALDTALRRRFTFVEMMPKYDLEELNFEISGKKLGAILEIINDRIVWLKGREQQIGHSYFFNFVKGESEADSLEKLKNIFKNQIVPLLQEYFYGDYYQIGLVIGDSFVRKEKKCEFAKGFVDNSDRDDLYRLLTDEEWKVLDMEKAITNLFNSSGSNNSTQSGEEASIDN